MTTAPSRYEHEQEVQRQVGDMLARSTAFHSLPPGERETILRNTAAIVGTLAENRLSQAAAAGDPFAVPMGPSGSPFPTPGGGQQGGVTTTERGAFLKGSGGATQRRDDNIGPKSSKDFGAGIAMGVQQTGELLREVNFPNFVAELIQGVFQAVVDASIQQMKAYGELVQSVAMSLSDFRDQNVSENQGRDHLVGKYPTLMQVNIVDGQPRVGPRANAGSMDLPNFKDELGLDEDVTELDEETIEDKLVPAARNDLARSRQTLLATMLLMGINRIVVTDGKINAKLRFDFRARDSQTTHAQNFDYKNYGQSTVSQSEYESGSKTGESYKSGSGGYYTQGYGTYSSNASGESDRWSKGTYQTATAPVIYLTKQEDSVTNAEVSAEGQLRGEVSLNFKSETVDLNKLASEGDIFKLERVRSAGRGAPVPAGAGAPAGGGGAGSTPPAAGGSTAPAPAPAAAR
ncbi:hypothetical protein [Longimicrobium sp.]|uniref:hypothetical protein n=1 Tax=Longimicrobium sp. TaxID=2029185 RepID=UPI002C26D75A|nr:hypothetical protein [Longimicrobium sp.]HSU14305.1 hypothetical protein [Longimicrobium sp.]